MKKFTQRFVLLLSTFFCFYAANSQQLKITDFLLFSGSGLSGASVPGAPGCGVIYGSSYALQKGAIGSFSLVKATDNAVISGNIYSGGKVILANNNTVSGKITAANAAGLSGTILQAGYNANLSGNIDVKGNIVVTGGIVTGKVTHPAGTTYTGPLPAGGNITGTPQLPILPALPEPVIFPAATSNSISNTQTISPGNYGTLKLGGNKTITFNGPGVYVFSSMSLTNSNTFNFNFQNNTKGQFRIYVHGDANLDKIFETFSNGGSADRIYAEIHGKGAGSSSHCVAFAISNGSSCGNGSSKWMGTVYCPYGAIDIGSGTGSSQITGAFWSGTQVKVSSGVRLRYLPFIQCKTPIANAGPDKNLTCSITSVVLNGSCSTPNVEFSWTAINGGKIESGENTAKPTVSKAGTYVLTVTNPVGGCKATDTAIVTYTPCIFPYYPPPPGGKVTDLIGSELSSLYDNFDNVGNQDTLNKIFTLLNDSVIIEVIALDGKYNELLALLQTPAYGLTDLINNGPGSLIIAGKYPIANLKKLDSLPQLINYCRPVFPPVSNSGIVNSSGDTALYTNLVRNGYHLSGDGVKVGVISNSYNTLPGNPAQTDIVNGDLPGAGNPDEPEPVHVLQEYPYGRATDEGRAMLQIVHDIAPKAKLAFRTGFISAGDFAEGIRALKDDSCNIVVDDVTFITEPFFKDGVVSKAVDDVTTLGVSYFTAAGNFGSKSYRNQFHPVAAPSGITGFAHDFGGGDINQSLSLAPGTYTIVLQWDDDIYSLDPSTLGAKNDFDIYLTDNSGNILFGFNRNNLGGDPIEVMPFTVTSSSQSNIMIIRAAGSGIVDLKYIVFRGEPVINEYNAGTSTIVGQANSAGAMTVGAVLYSNTPAYGVNPPTIASFSSTGGNALSGGIVRNKPDFAGPNGINTTVYLGGVNIDGDLFPNFFGTSAAAPHIAGVAALLVEARKRYYFEQPTSQQVRTILQNNAVDMDVPGYDTNTGYGFVQADSALRSIASPTPSILQLLLPDTSIVPGTVPFVVTVKGNYLSNSTQILFRGQPLNTTVLSSSYATATIPTFEGFPAIQAYTPSVTPSGLDGGYSDSLFFFAPVKKNITVTAKNATKRFGEQLPEFSVDILVDSIPVDSTAYTLADLGLDSIYYSTSATASSNTGIYYIRPAIKPFDPLDSADVVHKEMYNYSFNDGLLSVQKMPLTVTPLDTTLIYGDKIGNFNYQFDYPDSLISELDKTGFYNNLEADYRQDLAEAVAIADGKALVNGRALVNADLENLSFLVSAKALVNARPLVNAKPLVNSFDTTLLVDIAVESIFNYQEDSASATLISATPLVNAKALVNAKPLVNGTALVNSKPLVNGSPLVNSNSVGDSTGSDIAVIIDEEDVNESAGDSINHYKSINLITGTTAGQFAIVPGAFLSENFDVKYMLGQLNINASKLKVKANDVTIVYGATPVFTSSVTGYQYGDDSSTVLNGPVTYTILDAANKPVTESIIPAGTYKIVPNLSLIQPSNYIADPIAGTLNVNCAALFVKADDKTILSGDQPVFTSVITGFAGNDSLTAIISGPVYTTNPPYTGLPGTYSIIPSGLVLAKPSNYKIAYLRGKLCVNPRNNFANSITLKLDCIEPIHKKPYKYTARFSYVNNNNMPVSIPAGSDNYVTTNGQYSVNPPETFKVGKGCYNVDFSGSNITWTIQYYLNGTKVIQNAVATTSSPKCDDDDDDDDHHLISMTSQSNSALLSTISGSGKPLFEIYPNPASDKVIIHIVNINVSSKNISLFDLTGKSYAARIISNDGSNIVLNISHLPRGMYLVKIINGSTVEALKMMKQ